MLKKIGLQPSSSSFKGGLGDEAGVAKEKGQIFGGRPGPSVAVLPEIWADRLGLIESVRESGCSIRRVGESDASELQLRRYRPGIATGAGASRLVKRKSGGLGSESETRMGCCFWRRLLRDPTRCLEAK